MSNIDIKQLLPLSTTLFGLYIDELETCWTRLMGFLCVYLQQWLAFFFMLMYCSTL